MSDLPRLVLEHSWVNLARCDKAIVTLTERPMMECPFGGVPAFTCPSCRVGTRRVHDCPRCGGTEPVHKAVPIRVGQQVEVGWWRAQDIPEEPRGRVVWWPVATATVAEVEGKIPILPSSALEWHVTLVDIEAVS